MTDTEDKAQPAAPPKGKGRRKKTVELTDAYTLAGDLRDAILTRLRNLPEVWAKLAADAQREQIEIVSEIAQSLVGDMVRLIHGSGAPAMPARVRRASVKKELELVLSAPKDHALRHEILDAVEENVIIVITDPVRFFGASGPAEPDSDQRELDVSAATGKKKGGASRPVTAGKSSVKRGAGDARKGAGKFDPNAIFKKTPPRDETAGDITEPEIVTDASFETPASPAPQDEDAESGGAGDDFDPETGEVLE